MTSSSEDECEEDESEEDQSAVALASPICVW